MPGLLDLENHFPPEKVEAVYAALTHVSDDLLLPSVTEPGRRVIVGAFCAELRRHGFVVTAFPPAELRAWLIDQARQAHDAAEHPDGQPGDPGGYFDKGAAHMADATLTWLSEAES